MAKIRKTRLAAALAVLAIAAVLVPGTPIYLPNLLPSKVLFEGHGAAYWIKALDSSDAETRGKACRGLGSIGSEAGDAAPRLATLLREDADAGVRREAGLALSKMAPASRSVVPELALALEHEDAQVRWYAALCLFSLKVEARPAVPALLRALDEDRNRTSFSGVTIQEWVATALGRASAGSADAVPALTRTLVDSRNESTRLAAVRALSEVGAAARPAAPQLRALLADSNSVLREFAAEALEKIDGSYAEVAIAEEFNNLQLPDSERSYLWQIEHHGNVLVKHGFGPLAAALRQADASALTRLLAEDFSGTDLGQPERIRSMSGDMEIERLQDSGHPSVSLSGQAFVSRLMESRRLFAETPPGVKLALMTLAPKVRGRLDGAWEGTAQLRLWGEHKKGAPAEVVLMLRYQVNRPTEAGLAQGWLHGAAIEQVLTARAPHYLFAEVARERGLDTARLHDNWKSPDSLCTMTGGVYVCDFDRDGILDMLITDVSGTTLYRGRGDGSFEDVTERYGLPRPPLDTTVAAWIDIDGDGWEDLILGNRIFRNEQGKRFVDYTSRCNLRLPRGTTGIVVADYDRDGRVDLFVARGQPPGKQSWLSGRSGDSEGNYLFRNLGDWQFEDVTRKSGTATAHCSSFTAAWLDANNDGWPDLHVINEFGDGVLLINNQNGTFTPHALADRPADFGSMGVAVGDIDNDGNIDIYCANMYSKAGTRVIGNLADDAYPPAVLERMRRFVAGSQLHLNKGGTKFEQAGKKMQVAGVGWAYGACLADLDNDGWLDIYATAGFVSRSRDEPDG